MGSQAGHRDGQRVESRARSRRPYGLDEADVPSPDSTGLILTHDEIESLYRGRITRLFDERDPRPDWLLQFALGDVGSVLVHQSERAALLVVGTREHVGRGRLLTGSVSTTASVTPAVPSRRSQTQSAGQAFSLGSNRGDGRDRRPSMSEIVVGLDLSPASHAALAWAADQLARPGFGISGAPALAESSAGGFGSSGFRSSSEGSATCP